MLARSVCISCYIFKESSQTLVLVYNTLDGNTAHSFRPTASDIAQMGGRLQRLGGQRTFSFFIPEFRPFLVWTLLLRGN